MPLIHRRPGMCVHGAPRSSLRPVPAPSLCSTTAARFGASHRLPMVPHRQGVVPGVGGVVVKGALRTMVMGPLAAQKGDMVVEVPGGPNMIIMGMMGAEAWRHGDGHHNRRGRIRPSPPRRVGGKSGDEGDPAGDDEDESKSLGSMWKDFKDNVEEKYKGRRRLRHRVVKGSRPREQEYRKRTRSRPRRPRRDRGRPAQPSKS